VNKRSRTRVNPCLRGAPKLGHGGGQTVEVTSRASLFNLLHDETWIRHNRGGRRRDTLRTTCFICNYLALI